MFTGIVEATTAVVEKHDTGLVLARPTTFDDVKIGSSIAINGVCLSAVSIDNDSMSFSIVEETWKKTNLGDLTTGMYVNVERSMGAQSRFEGHIVQGHVEGTAEVTSMKKNNSDEGAWLTVSLSKNLRPYVLHKGSIAINGVSLTVAELKDDQCSIALIPHTLSVTTFKDISVGDRVNIETDILGRYVLAAHASS